MSISGLFKGVFGSSSIEKIATEWIQTDTERAEAKALWIKTLDPNGLMRRELSRRVAFLYTVYLLTTLALLTLEFFGVVSHDSVADASSKVKELFVPISTLFTVIVTASFGVNYANSKGGK